MDVQTAVKSQLRKNVPDIRSGQVVRVHERIKEGNKERVQVFEGLVISVKHGRGLNATFTVRKIGAGNVGVERIFPLHMPSIQKIEILREEEVRRSKLYYVRRQVNQKTKRRKTTLKNLVYDMGGTLEEQGSGEDEAGEESAESKGESEGAAEESQTQEEEAEEATQDSEEGTEEAEETKQDSEEDAQEEEEQQQAREEVTQEEPSEGEEKEENQLAEEQESSQETEEESGESPQEEEDSSKE